MANANPRQTLFDAPVGSHWNFVKILASPKPIRLDLQCGLDRLTIYFSVLTHYQAVTDEQTDMHFDDC